MGREELDAVEFTRGDITELEELEQILGSRQVTHVVHLAAMLIPLAAADPPRGAAVNVVGTVNVFEAAKRHGVAGLAYASSAAAYDRADGLRVVEGADGHPTSHYGVHKQANEGTARVYWRDGRLASVGLRPHVVYGPGRDHGLTAGPTLAMLAAARGEGLRDPVRRPRPVPVRGGRRTTVHRSGTHRVDGRGGAECRRPVRARDRRDCRDRGRRSGRRPHDHIQTGGAVAAA